MYLDEQFSFSVLASQWAKIGTGNAAFLNGTKRSGDVIHQGGIPKWIATAWDYWQYAQRRRYEYTYNPIPLSGSSQLIWTFTVTDANGQVASYQWWDYDNVIAEDGDDLFMGDVHRPSATPVDDQPAPLWHSLQGFFDFMGWPVPALPATISWSVTRRDVYSVEYRDDLCIPLTGVCTENTHHPVDPVSFTQTLSGASMTIEARSGSMPLLVDGECGVSSVPLYPDSGNENIHIQATVQNSTNQSMESYTAGLNIMLVGGSSPYGFAGTILGIDAQSWSKQTFGFDVTLANMLGQSGTITPGTYTIRMRTLKGEIESDFIDYTVVVNAPPLPKPHIVDALTVNGLSSTDVVTPDQTIDFHIVLERAAEVTDHLSDEAWLAVLCNGKVTPLWTGTFPAGDPGSTRVALDYHYSLNELSGTLINTNSIQLVSLLAGNGTVPDVEVFTGQKSWNIWVDVPNPVDTGAIQVSSTPSGAPFTLTGPATFQGTTPWEDSNAPAGAYKITWGAMTGYVRPDDSSQALDSGGAIAFDGTYTAGVEPPAESKSWLGPALLVMAAAGVAIWAARRKPWPTTK